MSVSPTKYPTLYRTYCRKPAIDSPRETEAQAKTRCFSGISEIGKFSPEVEEDLWDLFERDILFPSGRSFWVSGTEFSKKPENFYSFYNCASIRYEAWIDLYFNYLFLMMGCGVGDILEFENVDHFPSIKTPLTIKVIGDFGTNPERNPQTTFTYQGSKATLTVGDSKEGWALAYLRILTVSSTEFPQPMEIELDISNVRPAGEVIKGFGGVTNPSGLIGMFVDMVKVLNNAVGRQLTPLEVSLLGNLSARCTVAGNIRRSAKIGQFSSSDSEAASAKDNLWTQAEDGTWKVDPAKDPLRMSNFTRVWHTKPTLDEIKAAVRKQHQSGEGAIMYAPEALARANVDLLRTSARRQKFLDEYSKSKEQGTAYIQSLMETSNDN